MKRSSFADVARDLERMSTALRSTPHRAAKLSAPVIVGGIREEIGHAPPLAHLAEATQITRAREGYAPDEPLKKTGTLAESYVPLAASGLGLIEHDIHGSALGAAVSADERAEWLENGFINARTGHAVPPRPVGRLGLTAVLPMLKTIWANLIGNAIGGR